MEPDETNNLATSQPTSSSPKRYTLEERREFLRRLQSSNAERRRKAIQEITEGVENSLPLLLELMGEAFKQVRLCNRRANVCLFLWWGACLWLLSHGFDWAGALVIIGAGIPEYWRRSKRAFVALYEAMPERQSVRVLPYLLEYSELYGFSATLEQAVITLLESTEAKDAPLFHERHFKILSAYLLRKANFKEEVKIAILGALPKIGDGRALVSVEALMKDTNRSRYKVSARVYDKARECLPSLESNIARIWDARDLLRASPTLIKREEEAIDTPELGLLRSMKKPE